MIRDYYWTKETGLRVVRDEADVRRRDLRRTRHRVLRAASERVHVVVDAASSQQAFDREVALERMSKAGAYLTTAQSAAFMLMKSADHPNFKAVSKLTVQHMKQPNEFNTA